MDFAATSCTFTGTVTGGGLSAQIYSLNCPSKSDIAFIVLFTYLDYMFTC